MEVTLQKEGDKGIGITIVGGETTSNLDLGIFVKSVIKDGPAARSQQIQAGDRLIAINGISLEGVQHHEAVQLIRDSEGSVRLLLSQMRPPLTVRRKLNGAKTNLGFDEVDLCKDEDELLESCVHVSPDHPSNVPSQSHSHHLSVHRVPQLSPRNSDFRNSGSLEPVNSSLSESLAVADLDTDCVGVDARDEVLLSEEMLAAAEMDSQSYSSGDVSQTLNAETQFDKETQELQILGDIADMTVDNSDTDSDFESAVQATVEGRVMRSFSGKTCETDSSPLRKGTSVSSPDTIIYEVVLEKEEGSLGIITSEGEQPSRLYVQSLVPGGPAELGGILQPGDCLLELNGHSLRNLMRTDLEKAVQTAPEVCLLKVARTKSLDNLTQNQPSEQFNKGPGPTQPDEPVMIGESSLEEMEGLPTQISPPSAFASAVPTPVKDSSCIPVVPPPPSLSLSLRQVEDDRSNNTQSDVDSDVLDSSRSELEHIYKCAEKYLEEESGDIDLDAVMGVAGLNMSADDTVDGGKRQRGSKYDGELCGVNEDSSAREIVRHTSPPTVCSVGAALPGNRKSLSKSLTRQEHVTDTSERETDTAADEQVSVTDQVEEFTVDLVKSSGGGLGFTVVGGVTTTGGCYIKAVVQDPARSDGRLHAGDRLIQVNGQDMTGLSHFEAVTFLRQTHKEVSVKVWRYKHTTPPIVNPPHATGKKGLPDKRQHVTGATKPMERCAKVSRLTEPDEHSSECVREEQQASAAASEDQQAAVDVDAKCVDTPRAIIRPYTHAQQNSPAFCRQTGMAQVVLDKSQLRDSLGFSLVQRRMDSGQTGIFIKTLTPGGIAQTDGQLRVGDRLLQVNGESLIGCSHTKAVRLLRETAGSVVLNISRFPEDRYDSTDTDDAVISSGDTSRLTSQGNSHGTPATLSSNSSCVSDDDINDILDEAMNFLDSEDLDEWRSVKGSSKELSLLTNSGAEEQGGQEHRSLPSILPVESHPQSNPITPGDCAASASSPLVHSQVSRTSDRLCGKQKETKVDYTSFVREMPSVEMPEDLTLEFLCSLPVLRMKKELEERTVQLLQFLADAVEQEEPLLEFEKLRQMKITDNMEVAKLPQNKSRNRYRNVLPYDYNRVQLQTSAAEDNDYINASHVQLSVKGEAAPLRYIACQGPLAATQGHFWQMVWETGSNVVVMLTQEVELDKVKCHRYWPQDPHHSLDLSDGRYSVHLVKEEKLEDFDVRRLRLTAHDCGEEREVMHLHYTAWPDHGVPDSAFPLLLFVRLMHCLHKSGPFVVHCSAGIGRSGVLIAVDTALASIENGDELDLFDIVSEMRQQRYGMIQTQDQYLFCYTACMEALLSIER